jgi:transposase-like protein
VCQKYEKSQKSHEVPTDNRRRERTKIRSSTYLNDPIEQDHRSIKLCLGPMLGLKRFRRTSITIAGIELMHPDQERSVETRQASH